MDQRDKILQIVRMKGPLLPGQINKELNTNVLFASAMLSELVNKKLLKISNVKVGGSPLYYAEGQESKLQQYYKHLHEKEQRTYELLKENIVLKDEEQTPLVRATLRQIKDYAVPLEVNLDNTKHLFWKWYLLQDSEAAPIIKQKLGIEETKIEEEKPKIEEEIQKVEEKIIEKKIEPKSEKIKETQKLEPEKKQETKVEEKQEKKDFEFIDDGVPKDNFFREIKKYFDKNKIKIINYKIHRKESDIEMTIVIPSSVGILNYYCRAKNKKKCNDGDLSSAYIYGQSRKLPTLFITTGEITKKAKETMDKEFRNMKHIRI